MLEAKDTDFATLFSRDGLDVVYKAALGVAAARPELFVKNNNGDADDIARQLISRFATVLKDDDLHDGMAIAPKLGAVVLEVIQANTHLYLDKSQPWEALAADLLKSVLTGLKSALSGERLKDVFSHEQLVELCRMVLNQVAATPSMIVKGNAEVTRLVSLIASMIAADDDLLLTSEDWRAIAQAVIAEAAANPGRLFDLDGTDPNQKLAAELIGMVLKTASESMQSKGRAGGAVLFGETLRDAILILIAATAGNAQAAKEHSAAIRDLLEKLTALVADHKEHFGSKEWLALFRHLLTVVLSGETIDLDLDTLIAILAGDAV